MQQGWRKQKRTNSKNLADLFCPFSQKVAYSCSADGSIMVWDVATLQVGHQRLHFKDDFSLFFLIWYHSNWFCSCCAATFCRLVLYLHVFLHFIVALHRWSATFASPASACSPSPTVTGHFGAVGCCLWHYNRAVMAADVTSFHFIYLFIISSCLHRLQGRNHGVVEERLSQESTHSAGPAERHQLSAALSRGSRSLLSSESVLSFDLT